METLDDLDRAFLDGVYTLRIPIAVGSMLAAVVILASAWRAGWFASARRHPGRAVLLLAIVLVAGIPLGYYLASPIWIRTELIEPEPVAEVVVVPSSPSGGSPAAASSAAAGPSVSAAPTAAPSSPDGASTDPPSFAARTVATGRFHGTDDFHFGRGTARMIETAPAGTRFGSPSSPSGTAPTCLSTSPWRRTTTRAARSNSASSRPPTERSATTCRPARTRPISRARSSGASSSRTCSRRLRWPPSDARGEPKVRYWRAWGMRVPSRLKTPRKGRG